MDKQIINKFIEEYKSAEMVVIGVGSQLHSKVIEDVNELEETLHFYQKILDKKNYFIISTLQENLFEGAGYNKRRLVHPMMIEGNEEEEKQWDLYNKWLSATLNKKLMIIELGEDFNHPNVFRWPFEKVVFINQKSCMYRIHDIFYQLPENISERAVGIESNAYTFLKEVKAHIS